MSRVFQNIDPPSPSHTSRAERGVGGQYFGRRETQDWPLTVIISLRSNPSYLRISNLRFVIGAVHYVRVHMYNRHCTQLKFNPYHQLDAFFELKSNSAYSFIYVLCCIHQLKKCDVKNGLNFLFVLILLLIKTEQCTRN